MDTSPYSYSILSEGPTFNNSVWSFTMFAYFYVLVAILSFYVDHIYTVQPNAEKKSSISYSFYFKQLFN